jgi:phosphomannomutase
MLNSEVKFGTSGARGLVTKMNDFICYSYTIGFLKYLEEIGEISKGIEVAIAGDLRPSTNNIMRAVHNAITDFGYKTINCGEVPSPTVVLYGLNKKIPAIMVTGSHIPADRNGIKFNKISGEILKSDEPGITSQVVSIDNSIFDNNKQLIVPAPLPDVNIEAKELYIDRYLNNFPSDCLKGLKLGIYQHSAVGRDIIADIFTGLGAETTLLGRSELFIPVDTEAIREEDIASAQKWAKELNLDAVISTDGDSDRPLLSDENGEWLRGDILGILAATYLKADSISTPVSCNTALEKTNQFKHIDRTKIGSPYVVASMIAAADSGYKMVVGYEANGGFLTNSIFKTRDSELQPLPTRDAVLPVLSTILLAKQKEVSISELLKDLPKRFTISGLIRDFPTEESKKIMQYFEDSNNIVKEFESHFGKIKDIDNTDGKRIEFENNDIVHIRPSGNAPEFRCYNESSSLEKVIELQKASMNILLQLKKGL